MPAFAAIEARLGPALVARLANARAVFATGAPVACIFSRTPVQGALGNVGMQARDISLQCVTSALPAGITEGSAVSVYVGEQLVTVAGAYVVARGGRADAFEPGMTRLQLELAT